MAAAAVFDHLIFPTTDLDALEQAFSRLGFSLSPRKSFPFGDARVENHLIYLNGGYIELIDVKKGDVSFVRAVLEKRQGPAGLALRCDEPQSRRARAEALGFDVQCTEFDVSFTVDGKTYEGEFRASLFLSDRYPVTWMQLIEETRPYDRSPFFKPHDNGADRLQKLVIVAGDVEKTAGIHDVVMDGSFGAARAPFEWHDGVVAYAAMTPADFEAAYDDAASSDAALQPCFAAAHFLVRDLGAAASHLKSAGVDFTEKNGAIIISSSNAGGLTVVFED